MSFLKIGGRSYCFAADWLSIHVSGRRGQGFPVSSFVIGDEGCHFAIDLLIGQEDSFDTTYLGNKVDLQQPGLTLMKYLNFFWTMATAATNYYMEIFSLRSHWPL